jgi:outer membrane lipoprotein-sorting protein
VTGKETVNGKPAYVLLATPAEGQPTRYSFDAETGLMVKQHSTRESPQGPLDVDVFLEDFRDVDGLKLPFTIRQVTSIFTMVVRLTEIKHNVTLDDAIFKKPGYGDLRGTSLPVSR